MKRSEVIKKIKYYLVDMDYTDCDEEELEDSAYYLLRMLEDIGMLPPLSEVKAVPDPNRPGKMMHTESKREWDDEEN